MGMRRNVKGLLENPFKLQVMIKISCCMYSKKCLDDLSYSAAFMKEINLLFRLLLPLSSADERKKSITQITVLECFLETFNLRVRMQVPIGV